VKFGSAFGARYTLLRVLSPLAWELAQHSYNPYPAAQSPMGRQLALAELERDAAPLRALGHAVATHVIDAPSPAPAILAFAAGQEVDAIVIGAGGRGPLRRMLLGSVSDQVVRGSAVPVMICNTRRLAPAAQLAGAAGEGGAAGA
jgi:nucleotide-binding universal stress UspA family protein